MKVLQLVGQKFGKLTVIKKEIGVGRSRWLCQCECGNEKIVAGDHLKGGDVKSCGCRQRYLDLTGEKYGKLTVISKTSVTGPAKWLCRCDCGNKSVVWASSLRGCDTKSCGCLQQVCFIGEKYGKLTIIAEEKNKNGPRRWICQCECGNKKTVITALLRNGNTKSCGCIKHRRALNWCGAGEITGSYWSHVKHNARLKKKAVKVTLKDIWEVFLSQDKKCAISGVDLVFARNYIKNPHSQTASLDRIDSSKGYVLGNVQWVHKIVNKMKNTLTDDELINWSGIIARHNKK